MTRARLVRLVAAFVLACLSLVALACGTGLTGAQMLPSVDAFLNSVCSGLTFLKNQIAICAGVQGAEVLANLIDGFVETSPEAKLAAQLGRLRMRANPATPYVKIHGLPVFAPPDLAAVLNEEKQNAALLAYVAAGLEQAKAADAGAPSADGGR